MQKADLFEKTKRRIRMKTPFGPSLKAFGAFFDDKAADWDQLDWDKFGLSVYAAMELAEDIDTSRNGVHRDSIRGGRWRSLGENS